MAGFAGAELKTLFMIMLRVARSAAITAASTRNDPNLFALLGTGWASSAGDFSNLGP